MKRFLMVLFWGLMAGRILAADPAFLFSVERLVNDEYLVGSVTPLLEQLAEAKGAEQSRLERQLEKRMLVRRGMAIHAFPEPRPNGPNSLPLGRITGFERELNDATGCYGVFFLPAPDSPRLKSRCTLYVLSPRPLRQITDLPLDDPDLPKEERLASREALGRKVVEHFMTHFDDLPLYLDGTEIASEQERRTYLREEPRLVFHFPGGPLKGFVFVQVQPKDGIEQGGDCGQTLFIFRPDGSYEVQKHTGLYGFFVIGEKPFYWGLTGTPESGNICFVVYAIQDRANVLTFSEYGFAD